MNEMKDAKADAMAQAQISATIAAGIIAAMGRPVSMREVEQIVLDVGFTFRPAPGHGRYDAWKKSFDPNKKYL